MKVVISQTTGKTYKFYETSREIPIVRWNSFISFVIQNSELGPNFESCVGKLGQLDDYLLVGDRESFSDTRSNLQFQLFYIFRGINPVSHALAQLLYSIDNEKIDHTDVDLHNQLEEDEVFTLGLVNDLVEGIRKK